MAPLVESLYPYCAAIGMIAMEMRTRSRAQTAPITQQRNRTVEVESTAPTTGAVEVEPTALLSLGASAALPRLAQTSKQNSLDHTREQRNRQPGSMRLERSPKLDVRTPQCDRCS